VPAAAGAGTLTYTPDSTSHLSVGYVTAEETDPGPCVTIVPVPPVSIDWITVGNAGNAADPLTGYGAVGYVYNIGTYEVTNAQYVEFLNAKGASNSCGIFTGTMGTVGAFGSNITQSGSSGTYTYSVTSAYANLPVVGVTWFDAARFCNWLQNGQGNASMETGAYTLNGAISGVITVNAGAQVYIPSRDEWYKAAYFNGGTSTYSIYPNGQNVISHADANYLSGGLVDVGYGTASVCGTYGQGGNAWEWNDAVVDSVDRELRGGDWTGVEQMLGAFARLVRSNTILEDPAGEDENFGFRVASVPIAVWLASKGFSPATDLLTPIAALGGTSLLMAYALNLDPNQSSELSVRPQKSQCVEQVGFPEARAG